MRDFLCLESRLDPKSLKSSLYRSSRLLWQSKVNISRYLDDDDNEEDDDVVVVVDVEWGIEKEVVVDDNDIVDDSWLSWRWPVVTSTTERDVV